MAGLDDNCEIANQVVCANLLKLPYAIAKAEYFRFQISQTEEWLEEGSLRVHLYSQSPQSLALRLLPWRGKLLAKGPQALRDMVLKRG
jgi:hypothetical protein